MVARTGAATRTVYLPHLDPLFAPVAVAAGAGPGGASSGVGPSVGGGGGGGERSFLWRKGKAPVGGGGGGKAVAAAGLLEAKPVHLFLSVCSFNASHCEAVVVGHTPASR